jgi:hypothetical protein
MIAMGVKSVNSQNCGSASRSLRSLLRAGAQGVRPGRRVARQPLATMYPLKRGLEGQPSSSGSIATSRAASRHNSAGVRCEPSSSKMRTSFRSPSGPNLTLGTHRQTADLGGAKTLTGANLIGSPRTNPIVPAGPSAHANPVRRISGRRQRRDQ